MGEKKPSKGKYKPMASESLRQWRDQMGYEISEAAHELGCTQKDYRAWESGAITIPRYVGLACSALMMDMHAFGEDQ